MKTTTKVQLIGSVLLLAWLLTATLGAHQTLNWALTAYQTQMGRACVPSEPPAGPFATKCYAEATAVGPFLVRVRYGVGGNDMGWGVSELRLWLFGIAFPITHDDIEV